MGIDASSDLRSVLAKRTRASHDAVEAAFAAHELATEHGIAGALAAHGLAMERLLPALSARPEYHREVSRLRDLAVQGLDALGQPRPPQPQPLADELHALSVAYVILGSRLGAAVITQDLDRRVPGLNPQVRDFFADRNSASQWRNLRNDLAAVVDRDEQDRIVADAKLVFTVFAEAAKAAQAQPLAGICA